MPRVPEKIAILGGGAAALAAAYELTLSNDWSERYQITVYQTGWRLGGKGASGRNSDVHHRIEEHGLHVWPGFYDNAFRMIRHCYQQLNRPASVPIHTWNQAFQPQDHLAVEEIVNGKSEHWLFTAHRNPGEPGDPRPLPGLPELTSRVLKTIRSAIASLDAQLPAIEGDDDFNSFADFPIPFEGLANRIGVVRIDELLGDTAEWIAGPASGSLIDGILGHTIEAVKAWLRSREQRLTEINAALRRLWIYIDLATTNLRGMLADGVFFDDLDRLDGEDYRIWLARHGASQVTIDSALVRGLYAFVFADVRGQPDLVAGSALRLSLRTGFGDHRKSRRRRGCLRHAQRTS